MEGRSINLINQKGQLNLVSFNFLETLRLYFKLKNLSDFFVKKYLPELKIFAGMYQH